MLAFDDVTKKLGRIDALRGLTFTVGAGEVFGFLGPNGAGKTTSMAIACGLMAPDGGAVRVDGRDPRDPGARRAVGLCPQELALYDKLTAFENVVFFARAAGLSGRHAKVRAGVLLDEVGLTARARDRVEAFSGGMKRRLNFAVAIVHDPSLVLLDEPTVGVDPQSRAAIFELVRATRDRGKAVVYTTHYMEEAEKLCDRVGVIDAGRLLEVGTVDELVARRGGRTVVTVERGGASERIESDDPVATLAEHVGRGGVSAVRVDTPDLESVFLALTGRTLRDGDG